MSFCPLYTPSVTERGRGEVISSGRVCLQQWATFHQRNLFTASNVVNHNCGVRKLGGRSTCYWLGGASIILTHVLYYLPSLRYNTGHPGSSHTGTQRSSLQTKHTHTHIISAQSVKHIQNLTRSFYRLLYCSLK